MIPLPLTQFDLNTFSVSSGEAYYEPFTATTTPPVELLVWL
jgi:hypothetical protein